jgi:hypothetical protein
MIYYSYLSKKMLRSARFSMADAYPLPIFLAPAGASKGWLGISVGDISLLQSVALRSARFSMADAYPLPIFLAPAGASKG